MCPQLWGVSGSRPMYSCAEQRRANAVGGSVNTPTPQTGLGRRRAAAVSMILVEYILGPKSFSLFTDICLSRILTMQIRHESIQNRGWW
jgi:hypothetical protein